MKNVWLAELMMDQEFDQSGLCSHSLGHHCLLSLSVSLSLSIPSAWCATDPPPLHTLPTKRGHQNRYNRHPTLTLSIFVQNEKNDAVVCQTKQSIPNCRHGLLLHVGLHLLPFFAQTNKQTSKQNVHSLKIPTNPRMNE